MVRAGWNNFRAMVIGVEVAEDGGSLMNTPGEELPEAKIRPSDESLLGKGETVKMGVRRLSGAVLPGAVRPPSAVLAAWGWL